MSARCDVCRGHGWIVSEADGGLEVERCDECRDSDLASPKFVSDGDALREAIDELPRAERDRLMRRLIKIHAWSIEGWAGRIAPAE